MIPIAEDDERNEFGLPPVKVVAAERACQTTHVDQSVNKALPYVAFSWLLSGGALVGLFVLALLVPHLIDSKVEAGVAESKAHMSQQIAEVRTDTAAAKQNARLALSSAEKQAAALEARGLIKLENH